MQELLSLAIIAGLMAVASLASCPLVERPRHLHFPDAAGGRPQHSLRCCFRLVGGHEESSRTSCDVGADADDQSGARTNMARGCAGETGHQSQTESPTEGRTPRQPREHFRSEPSLVYPFLLCSCRLEERLKNSGDGQDVSLEGVKQRRKAPEFVQAGAQQVVLQH